MALLDELIFPQASFPVLSGTIRVTHQTRAIYDEAVSKIHIFELATLGGTEEQTKPAVVCLMKGVIVERASLENIDWHIRLGVRSGRRQS